MSVNEEELKEIEDIVRYYYDDKGYTYEEIRKLNIFQDKKELVDIAIKNFQQKISDIIHIPIPQAISDGMQEEWYPGPKENDIHWPKYQEHLKIEKEFPNDVIQSIDEATSKIIGFTKHPNTESFRLKGLIVGYVQSGKTANYTGVIAKAADLGYKLFIILTSCNNKLRRQTQARIESDLCAANKSNWHLLTTERSDFRANEPDPNSKLSKGYDRHGNKITDNDRTICIVKKNTHRLSNLIKWLKKADPDKLIISPVMIIDDEADQASINTSSKEDPSTINKKIRTLIELLNRVVYIGYTATPFANVLIDPMAQDLYPENFIFDLPKPQRYFGIERIFGRERLRYDDQTKPIEIGEHPSNPEETVELFEPGMDIINLVLDDEIYDLKPKSQNVKDEFQPKITKNLKSAIKYFWLATAARHFRGHTLKHSTMLIHTTSYSSPQNKFEDILLKYRNKCIYNFISISTRDAEINKYRKIWNKEQSKVDPSSLNPPLNSVEFDELLPHLKGVIKETQVFIENSTIKKEDRLVYGENPGIFIVVGGNILSRGLTLEGLVVSFFIRGASAYDTLIQMGRWFGFRIGYEDLPRIWMTQELKGFFFDLAAVEEEIRYDIQRYCKENITPLEFGVRIRTHPSLAITSRLKMKDIIKCEISYSEKRVQTTIFKREDWTWLLGNINATKRLFNNIGISPKKGSLGYNRACWGLENIDVNHILQFIKDYTFHENHIALNKELLKNYILEENKYDSLKEWNIIIFSILNNKHGVIDLGFGEEINLIVRSQATPENSKNANLKSIMLRDHTVLDLKGDDVEEMKKKKDDLFRFRTKKLPETGLLVIYPIYKESKPNENTKATNPNKPLNAKEHVIGVGFVFPKSKVSKGKDYISVNIKNPTETDIEDELVEDVDVE